MLAARFALRCMVSPVGNIVAEHLETPQHCLSHDRMVLRQWTQLQTAKFFTKMPPQMGVPALSAW